jgi:DNA-binding FadR family transcriptional regulator
MLPELNRDTLAKQVAQHLLEHIRTHHLLPGASLPSETKLAAGFGVSRAVVREALKLLEARGILEIVNGKSATVRPISGEILLGFFQRAADFNRETFLELIELRRGIEIHSAMLAARRRTPEELAKMRDVVARMREQLRAPDAFSDLDVEFHLLIAAASHNGMLYHLVKSIRDSLKDSILEGLRNRHDEDLENVQRRHEELLAALERGDAEEARRAMDDHFDEALKVIPEAER